MSTRRSSWFAGAAVLLVAGTAVWSSELRWRRATLARELSRLEGTAEALAREAVPLLDRDSDGADTVIRSWAVLSGYRVTLITGDGRVHADSWTLPVLLDRLVDHSQREEVQAAARGERVFARRLSVTTDRQTIYHARALGGQPPVGYVRVAWESERSGIPWLSLVLTFLGSAATVVLAERLSAGRERDISRHLLPWSDLPESADTEAVAAAVARRVGEDHRDSLRRLEVKRAALAQIAEGVVILDAQGVVHYANPAARTLVGNALDPGRALVEAVRFPDLLAAVRRVTAEGGTVHTECPGAGGASLAVRVCALACPPFAVAVVMRDSRSERQLERARRALVADLAHELRTPLTVLGGLAEELREERDGDELVLSLERQVRRLQAFAEELGELAALEAGHLRLNVEDTDAAAVTRQVLADFGAAARAAGVALQQYGESVPLRADPVRLGQVIGNLVDNGIRYNRPGGTVSVRVAQSGTMVQISVEDSGVGIPPEEVPLVFQRFYRVRRGAQAEGGTGLGLAIVKHLVHAMDGTVELASEEGRGTRVTLLVPRLLP